MNSYVNPILIFIIWHWRGEIYSADQGFWIHDQLVSLNVPPKNIYCNKKKLHIKQIVNRDVYFLC